jgi:hypothetical protein
MLCFINCSLKKELNKFDCVSIENEGYVKLKITKQIKHLEYNIESECKDAIKAILYSGYTSLQCQTQKPILKQTTDFENFRKIQSKFFSKNGSWKLFVQYNSNEQKTNEYLILINKEQLRKYLEEQKIIKSLNTGF